MLHSQSEISTLRVRGQLRDGPGVRLAVGSLLSGADLHPTGVAPSSILILKSLQDPLPGRLSLRTPGRLLDRSWERAVRTALDDWRRRAARPVGGKVPSGAAAVFFGSEAELLACLALAIARGESPDWWRPLALRRWSLKPGCRLAPLLLQAARPLPGALRELWRWGKAAEAVSALAVPQVRAVLARLAAEHRLDGLYIPADLLDGPSLLPPDRSPLSGRRAAPWAGWISPDPALLPLSRPLLALLGLGLGLAVRPGALHSRQFMEDWRVWWTDWRTVPPSASRRPPAVSDHSRNAPVQLELSEQRPPQEAAAFSRSRQEDDPARTTMERLAAPNRKKASRGPSRRSNGFPEGGAANRSDSDRGTGPGFHRQGCLCHSVSSSSSRKVEQASLPVEKALQRADPKASAGMPALPAEERRQQDLETPFEDGVETRLAGVFYLINLMQALELPGCFEEGWELSSRLGCWGLLESLGRAFLDGAGRDLDGDPLWSLVAELDGRPPNEPPGGELLGSPSFLLPAQWIRSLGRAGGSRWRWAANRKLVRVWSAEGFLLAEGPLKGAAPSRQARGWIESTTGLADPLLKRKQLACSPRHPLSELRSRAWNPHLLRWLSLVLPYLRWRLMAAFPNEGPDPVGEMLLRPGQVFLSSSHLDVVMRLEDASLPVRLAGLDRSPGWMPKWGRVVLFHFE